MHTILFDIDGTLIRTRGSGLAAIGRAMNEMFGIEELPRVVVHGRTDLGIVSDLFGLCGVSVEDHLPPFYELYWKYLPQAMNERGDGIVLPGVVELLEAMSKDSRLSLGLLTGNAEVPARIKLKHFGLDKYFSYGGFGDNFKNRDDVARQALSVAKTNLPDRFEPDKVWVIGDTVADITCARAIGASVVAVETGGGNARDLANAGPDILEKNLLDSVGLIGRMTATA